MAKTYLGVVIEDTGMSQNQVARLLSMNQGRISQLVNLKKKPTTSECEKFEIFFGLPSGVLFEEMEVQDGTVGTTPKEAAELSA